MRPFRGAAVLGLTAFVAAAVVLTGAVPASADGSVYGTWEVSGTRGTMTVPVTGFPSASFISDASAVQTHDEASSFLGANTPVGQVFGSSQGKPRGHAFVRPASRNQPSTTTFTFASPTPATGWAFTLGDIDADQVRIEATTAGGAAASVAQLGWQAGFNYCVNSPKPPTCGTGPFGDVPVWDPATMTLRGNGPDTEGSAGWFRPTAPLTSLTFVFSVQSGNPIYQIWFASLTKAISGALTGGCDGKKASGTVRLLDSAGTPVPGAETKTDDSGHYAFPNVAPSTYQVEVAPAEGMTVNGANPKDADLTRGDADNIDFALTCEPPPTTTTTPIPTSTTSPPVPAGIIVAPHRDTGISSRPLANTGNNLGPWVAGGAILIALGSTLLYLAAQPVEPTAPANPPPGHAPNAPRSRRRFDR